ncbi:hypothetical protein H072_10960 [Dactylellina haptotyla CBS 200.50]|uniref:F-box domain-containing protein n=1 Tax=Dactylellina haptotyla (strain CBS 200.50) TaxID=1284197 RepID=S7ZYS5_DACHA|nr:hypothetical protein H072_10960 [Dactylellina haptotyla CBS 200.50]
MKTCDINSLPNELIESVLSFLSIFDLLRAGQVCVLWRAIVTQVKALQYDTFRDDGNAVRLHRLVSREDQQWDPDSTISFQCVVRRGKIRKYILVRQKGDSRSTIDITNHCFLDEKMVYDVPLYEHDNHHQSDANPEGSGSSQQTEKDSAKIKKSKDIDSEDIDVEDTEDEGFYSDDEDFDSNDEDSDSDPGYSSDDALDMPRLHTITNHSCCCETTVMTCRIVNAEFKGNTVREFIEKRWSLFRVRAVAPKKIDELKIKVRGPRDVRYIWPRSNGIITSEFGLKMLVINIEWKPKDLEDYCAEGDCDSTWSSFFRDSTSTYTELDPRSQD